MVKIENIARGVKIFVIFWADIEWEIFHDVKGNREKIKFC